MEEHENNGAPDQAPDLPFSTKAGIFVGTVLPACAVDVLAHWGVTGLALGGFTAFALAKTSPQVYAQMRKHWKMLPAQAVPMWNAPQRRSLWDRLTNHYPEPKDFSSQETQPMTERLGPEEQEREDEFREEPLDEPEETEPSPTFAGLASSSRFLFSQVLTRFTPTLDRLFLALLPDGTPVYCAAKDLCHVALAGATGGGKSSILRLLLCQLCASGASVLLLNPHYTRYDREADPAEDWTPFEPFLVHDPMECRRYEVIRFYLKQVAMELLPKRLEKYAHSQSLGKPYFLAVEELPAIVAEIKEAPEYLARILREGRKVGIFLVTVATDFLVSTIAPGSGGGAVRDCYRTAYYVGGDGTTAKVLLDQSLAALAKVEGELGQGMALLRSSRVPLVRQACLVRVPYVDNRALYRLLGPSRYTPSLEHASAFLSPQATPSREPALEAVQPIRRPPIAPIAAPFPPSPLTQTDGTGPGTAGPRPVPVRLQQLVQVYEPGMSLTWLAGQLGVSEEKAYAWLREAKARGLLKEKTHQPGQHSHEAIHAPAQPEQHSFSPETHLSPDERRVLEAYRNGAKTGMAIKSVTGIAGTRVNECLHKLGPVLGLIDWQPRQK